MEISLGQLAAVTAAIAFLIITVGGVMTVLKVVTRPGAATATAPARGNKADRYVRALSFILPAEELTTKFDRHMAQVLANQRQEHGDRDRSTADWARFKESRGRFVAGQRRAMEAVFSLVQLEALAALYEAAPEFETLWRKAESQRAAEADALYAELEAPDGPASPRAERRRDRDDRPRRSRADGQNGYRNLQEPPAQAAG